MTLRNKARTGRRIITPQRGSGGLFSQKKQAAGFLANWRIGVLLISLVFIAVVIIFRLVTLQIFGYDVLSTKAREQHQFFEKLKPKRGRVLIKDGEKNLIPVATNEDKEMVFVAPKYIIDTEGTIKTLATILNLDEEEIRRKVMKKK
ncbi:MAG: hypothetical protein ABIC19_01830 [Patescibacteria group bacterium]